MRNCGSNRGNRGLSEHRRDVAASHAANGRRGAPSGCNAGESARGITPRAVFNCMLAFVLSFALMIPSAGLVGLSCAFAEDPADVGIDSGGVTWSVQSEDDTGAADGAAGDAAGGAAGDVAADDAAGGNAGAAGNAATDAGNEADATIDGQGAADGTNAETSDGTSDGYNFDPAAADPDDSTATDGAISNGGAEDAESGNETSGAGSSEASATDAAGSASAESTNASASASASASSASSEAAEDEELMPEQTFRKRIRLSEGDTLTVNVKAPKGAFPAGTVMTVEELDPDEVRDQVESVVTEEISWMLAVDISFFDENGIEISPSEEVEVKITSNRVREIVDPLLIHIDNGTSVPAAEVVEAIGSEGTASSASSAPTASGAAASGTTASGSAASGAPASDASASSTSADASGSAASASASAASASAASASASSSSAAAKPLPTPSGEESVEVVHDIKVVNESDRDRSTGNEDTLKFTTDKFSPYVIVETTIADKVLASDGHLYSIYVTYGPDAGIPAGATLDVREIVQGEGAYDGATEYETYVALAEGAIGADSGLTDYVRLFDISILDEEGNHIQPAEGSQVIVDIELEDTQGASDLQVVHFDGDDETQLVAADADADSGLVSFETDGFSVYAIIDAPEPIEDAGWIRLTSIDDIGKMADSGEGVYIGHVDGYYFTDELYNVIAGRTGIKRTVKASSPDSATGAVKYYFQRAGDARDEFYVYCLDDEGSRRYIIQSKNSLSLTDPVAVEPTTTQVDPPAAATLFTISAFPNYENTFRALGTDGYYWNRQGGDNGKGFAAYAVATDVNARIKFEYYKTFPDDAYELDDKTFGIAYHNESTSAAGLTAEGKTVSGKKRLVGKELMIKPDVLGREGILLVAQDTDLSEWTFESVGASDYHITTTVDGQVKYLTIDGDNVTLVDEPTDSSVITVTPGAGVYAGKYLFTSKNSNLDLPNGAVNGFGGSAKEKATTWMNLVDKSEALQDDDFVEYTAHKVSVSDTQSVPNGAQVVVYTRVWNEKTLRYEFYAVDYDGKLVRCYESGDVIQWVGSKVNTALWDFTEYQNADGTPNYYYELQNHYSGQYIAPQLKGEQILSKKTIGVNLNGRRYGDDYTKILAWDDPYYEYAGLKVKDGSIVSCPLSEADDFYFAIVKPAGEEELTTVKTIDNDTYGISMKMIDYNNKIVEDRDSLQTDILGRDTNVAGLVGSQLEENGYPKTDADKTGKAETSLQDLFNADQLRDVNQLFIESTYNESGYFEYDSTQNFAHLNEEDGTFTVYDQLAASGDNTGPSRTHGQFLPYDMITPGVYSKATNLTDVLRQPLSELDPRRGEKLYRVDNPDYFFGMQMEAGFVQTASGLDAWGHDIIFEFSGDDDFWFYVDGELVLDLGGVHSASVGNINFRTGVVETSLRDSKGVTDNSRSGTTTLRDVFEKNYRSRNPEATDADVKAYLDGIFVRNAAGNYVFKDYSAHTMKVFYMERGAGGSNLHMRFNLSAAKPGTVTLAKKISGTEKSDYALAEFPYQIWYKTKDDGDQSPFHLLEEKSGENYNVTYFGTRTPVKFAGSYTPAGGKQEYESVFFLQPGQTAEISMPEGTTQYYIVECGVNPNIYDKVEANAVKLTGTDKDNDGREDFTTSQDTIEARPKVEYDNHVNPSALRTLSITKKLIDEKGKPLNFVEDSAEFSFRLSLGSENDDEPKLVDMHEYYVKDSAGFYCSWDVTKQQFVSLGKTEFDKLTEAERKAATFVTSAYGAISRIPADHTIEVRELLVGTKFKVEERPGDIPAGYKFVKYERKTASYITDDAVNSGIIRDNSDPAIDVVNQRGWGLTVKKAWSDADFVESHDPIYFAVFGVADDAGDAGGAGGADGADEGELTLIDGTVRQMTPSQKSLYWYFDSLDKRFDSLDQYVVREVTLGNQNPTVDEDGSVFDYGSVTPIGEGGILSVNATPKGETASVEYSYSYKASYATGEPVGSSKNARTDTVTNTRQGIKIVKTDMEGKPLADADFTLTGTNGEVPGAGSYTSDENGLVTIAYLPDGKYLLTETDAPEGYLGLTGTLAISISGHGQNVILVSPANPGMFEYSNGGDDADAMPTITVRNRPYSLRAVKVGGEGATPLEGVTFALYRQTRDASGQVRKDYSPISGYEKLVSDENGLIAADLQTLGAGTYYLCEVETPDGYRPLESDVIYTVSGSGSVTLEPGTGRTLTSEIMKDGDKALTYTITIENATNSQQLPSSGGWGDIIMGFGLILLFAAEILLLIRLRNFVLENR